MGSDDTTALGTPPDEAALPRRFLRQLLLLALEHNGHSYGYELCETVRSRRLAVDLASVYRDLRAMEKHDLVSSTWEPSEAGPDRRIYSLTEIGLDAAAESVRELAMIRDGIDAALVSFGRDTTHAGKSP